MVDPYLNRKSAFIGLFGKVLGTRLFDWANPCCSTFCTDVNNCVDSNGVARWIKITKSYSALSANSTTNDISIYTLPAKGIILNSRVIPSTQFSGNITDYSVSVGVTGNVSIIHGVSYISTGYDGDLATGISVTSIVYSLTTTKDIRLYATSTGGNLNDVTAGSVDIYLLVSTLP